MCFCIIRGRVNHHGRMNMSEAESSSVENKRVKPLKLDISAWPGHFEKVNVDPDRITTGTVDINSPFNKTCPPEFFIDEIHFFIDEIHMGDVDGDGYPITSNALPKPIKPGFLSRIGDRLYELVDVIEASTWRDIAFWSGYIILIGIGTGAIASLLP